MLVWLRVLSSTATHDGDEGQGSANSPSCRWLALTAPRLQGLSGPVLPARSDGCLLLHFRAALLGSRTYRRAPSVPPWALQVL